MNILITIIAFLVIFSVLILIHECGHFFAAKKAGVKVEEFGFGLPPRMFGVKRGETLYSFNWIPFGGFVRMLGEDSTTKESKASKRSFENQPLRTQAFIVCAGVLMNLLLAFVLLTVGFVIGIEPLISTEEDFMDAIRDGTVQVEPGIVVVETEAVIFGDDVDFILAPGDRIVGVDGTALKTIEQWNSVVAELEAGQATPSVQVSHTDGSTEVGSFYKDIFENATFSPTYLPRLVYLEDSSSIFYGVLQNEDAIVQVDGKEILNEEDLYSALSGLQKAELTLYRAGVGELTVTVTLPEQHPLITYVEPGSPADTAGLQVGDQILSIIGVPVYSALEVTERVGALNREGYAVYEILRGGEILYFDIQPRLEDQRIGIALSDLLPNYGNLSLYSTYVPFTLMEIKSVSYGWAAPKVAMEEMWRLSKLTATMFVSVLGKFVTGAEVPAGVSGPVGIAQMTFVTVQAGFAATLRFVALLSLSLGVINILPFPALDGGKFFFIVVQGITGRKMNSKYEHLIHAAGFFFLILFIVYVTFNDVINLF